MQKKLTTSVEEDASVSEHYNEVCKREARVRWLTLLVGPCLHQEFPALPLLPFGTANNALLTPVGTADWHRWWWPLA